MVNHVTDVQLPDSCVRLVKHDRNLSWVEAKVSCGRLGGVLAVFSRPHNWLYVSRIVNNHGIHLHESTPIYVGIKAAPSQYPNM